MKLSIFILASLLASVCFCGHEISKFHTKPFVMKPMSGMYKLEGLGLNNITGGQQIVAYGDVDNDKKTDIITLTDDLKELTVHRYNKETFGFWPWTTITPAGKVLGVTTGDFNFDGKVDLLLTVNTPADAENDKGKMQVQYFLQQGNAPFFGLENNKPNLMFELKDEAHPFVIDVNGDRVLDVMYIEHRERWLHTIENGEKGPVLAKKKFSDYISKAKACKTDHHLTKYTFSTPHHNAFADFNGDCAADLMFTVKDADDNNFIEFWLRNPDDGLFCLVEVIDIDSKISSISISDMNNNGRLDLVYAHIPGKDETNPLTFNIIYNQFKTVPDKPCTLADVTMTSPFKATSFSEGKSIPEEVTVFTLPPAFSKETRLFETDGVHRPGKVRIGDINIDGYPDLLFIVRDPKKQTSTDYGNVVLAMNQANVITFNTGGEDSKIASESKAYYKILDNQGSKNNNDQELANLPATSASFFDFDEQGKLGLWIAIKDSKNPSITTLMGVFNFVSTENFILKALALNGKVPSSKDKILEAIGGLYYGATMECIVTDVNGSPNLSKAAQLPQSAYTTLDLPYMFLGLGRTNNYVETFTMGISRKDGEGDKNQQQQSWLAIIPNSQLIVNPYKEGGWTLDVFVNPTSEAFLISVATGVILLVLGVIIIYLHRKEKAEDVANQDRMIHIFG